MTKVSTKFNLKKVSMAVAITMALSGCGGSDNNNDDKPIPPTQPPTSTATNYTLEGDDTSDVSVGQPIGLVAASTMTNDIEDPHYSWQVTSGNADAVHIIANHQPATSIKIDEPGEYVVTLYIKNKASDSNAEAIEKIEKKIMVREDSTHTSTAHLNFDRAGISGGDVNLYFNTDAPLASPDDWTLRQVSGATAQQITKSNTEPYVQISLPTVTQDEVLVFEAFYTADPSITDTAYILVRPDACDEGNNAQSPNCKWNRPLNHLYAYQPTTVYSDRLVDCIMSPKVEDEDYCTMGELPYIGIDPAVTDIPSIEDIMSRVIVTHDWMGANFERFLREKDSHGDFRKLLRSTTAIVISEDINPAYYWSSTGAMHIEAELLWTTPEERATVTSTIDNRTGNGKSFDFKVGWEYETNGQDMFSADYFPPRHEGRSFEVMTPYLTSLLYHELAHASDVMPYNQMQILKSDFNKYRQRQTWQVIPDYIIAEQLSIAHPLQGDKILFSYEEIVAGGREPTSTDNYTGLQIANAFYKSNANDDYNFHTKYEDLAMLFEETMMLLRNDTNRYTAVWDTTGDQRKLIRGQKNRVTADNVAVRAQFVTDRILPSIKNDVNSKLSAMSPTELCPGAMWTEVFVTNCNTINPYRINYSSDRYSVDSNTFDKSTFDKSTFDKSTFDKSTFDKSTFDKSTFDKSTMDKKHTFPMGDPRLPPSQR